MGLLTRSHTVRLGIPGIALTALLVAAPGTASGTGTAAGPDIAAVKAAIL
jgi:hypothetical protein